MDVFENKVDIEKFKATNNIWNQLGLNSPDNIGMVSELITRKPFINKEEWEEYYYKHGRSKEYLRKVSRVLYNNLPKDLNISFRECCYCVWFRIIGETWNGIIVRESKTIEQLELIYDIFTFKKIIEYDFKYSVDYEMFYNDKLICGIQIKPTSYLTSNAEYILRAVKYNKEKNDIYSEKFNVPVITITSELNGIITSYVDKLELDKLYRKYLLKEVL